MTGHLESKVDFRGLLDPGSEEKRHFQGHVKIVRQIIRKMVCASPVGTLTQGFVGSKGREQKPKPFDSDNDTFVSCMWHECLGKGRSCNFDHRKTLSVSCGHFFRT